MRDTKPQGEVLENIEDYPKVYPKLKTMSGPRGLENAFGNGVGAHSKPLVSREPREVLTNFKSFDPLFERFIRGLSGELNDRLKPDLDAKKFTKTGIHATFDRLRTVPGYMMNPMSYTMLDNAAYRESLGLTPGYTAKQRRIAQNVWRHIFKSYKPSPVKVAKKSTSGPRRNTSDHIWKVNFALWIYQSDRFERVLQLIDKRDWLTLADEMEMLWMMYIQKRDQVDTPGKPREVFSLEYVLSGGKKGKPENADKKVVIDGKEWEDFSATRARVIHAGPWAINCILSIVSTGTMAGMFERYPETWHINTDEQIESVVNGHYVYCGDVKEFDRSMSKDAIDVVHEVALEFWDPRLVQASLMLYYSCYFARPLELGGMIGHWVGDPRSFDPQVICGNRSGHAWTSLVAKGNKVIDTLFIFDAMGLDVEGKEEAYLEAKTAISCVNNGDDEIVRTKNPKLMEAFEAKRENKSLGHYVVSREDGNVFSGKLLMLVDEANLIYKPTPRLHTAFEKIYCPERSIGGNFRPHWYIGVIERINNRDLHPMGGVAWEIHDRLYHDILEPVIGPIMTILMNAQERAPLDYDGLSAIDREVIEDPDKIHYKFTDGEVSDKVMNEIVTRIPFAKYEKIVRTYYRGHIMDAVEAQVNPYVQKAAQNDELQLRFA